MSVFVIAEIGINHNGSMDITKRLIDEAANAGCDAVKFQKRTVDVVYTKEELDKPRESPWGTTNREQKNGLEFSEVDYWEIDRYCKEKNIGPDIFSKYTRNFVIFVKILRPSKSLILSHKKYPPL